MKLIAFSGGMGCGKTTAIRFLEDYENKHVVCVKFASALYDMQEFIYRRIQKVHKRPDTFIKDRKLLQWLGTEWGRETISPSIWIDLWKEAVFDAHRDNPESVIVCDDCRFDNEAEALHALGGYIIKIESNKTVQRIDTSTGISNHKSEAGINNKFVDFMVSNDDTVLEFGTVLRNVYAIIGDHYNERAGKGSAV